MKYSFLLITLLAQFAYARQYNCKATNGAIGILLVSDPVHKSSSYEPNCKQGYYGEENCSPSYYTGGSSVRMASLRLKGGSSVFSYQTTLKLTDGNYDGYSSGLGGYTSNGVSIFGDVNDSYYKVVVSSRNPSASFNAICN